MHASARGGSSFALVEPLERCELLSFDPSRVGAINAGEHSWKAAPGAADYFLENHRIGYMVAALDGTLAPTSYARGGDPWSYVPGGRYQFKNGAGVPIGTLTLRNVQSTHVTVERYWAENWDEPGIRTGQKGKWNGVHTDGIYIENLSLCQALGADGFEGHVRNSRIYANGDDGIDIGGAGTGCGGGTPVQSHVECGIIDNTLSSNVGNGIVERTASSTFVCDIGENILADNTAGNESGTGTVCTGSMATANQVR